MDEEEVEVASSDVAPANEEEPDEEDVADPNAPPPLRIVEELDAPEAARAAEEPEEDERVSPIEDDAPPLGRGFRCNRKQIRVISSRYSTFILARIR